MTTDTDTYADTLPRILPQPITVPIFDASGREADRHVGVSLRYSDGTVSPPVSVVGRRYTPPDLASLGAALDRATAPLGGALRLGPPRAQISPRGGLSVILGRPLGLGEAILLPQITGDPSPRVAYVRAESALDGSAAESIDVFAVRVACRNGLVGWGSVGGFQRRHTARLDAARDTWALDTATALPAEISRQGRILAHLRDRTLTPGGVDDVVTRLVSSTLRSEDAPPDLTSYQRAQRDAIVGLLAGADGTYVPGPAIPGTVDVLQVIEAVTAYDRHHARGSLDQRRDRVLAGRGLGAQILGWGIRLAADAGVI